jgi:hypothetical protein
MMKKYRKCLSLLDIRKCCFITLTQQVKGNTRLRASVEKIRSCWRKLIRLDLFKQVRGGLYTIECKWSKQYGAWNVHIHAVVEIAKKSFLNIWWDRVKKRNVCDVRDLGRVLPEISIQKLNEEWLRLTGDSMRTNIIPVEDKEGILAYILKYMVKELDLPRVVMSQEEVKFDESRPKGKRFYKTGRVFNIIKTDPRRIEEYNRALKGVRLVQTFGTWYPLSKEYRFAAARPELDKLTCENCGGDGWILEVDPVFPWLTNLMDWSKEFLCFARDKVKGFAAARTWRDRLRDVDLKQTLVKAGEELREAEFWDKVDLLERQFHFWQKYDYNTFLSKYFQADLFDYGI